MPRLIHLWAAAAALTAAALIAPAGRAATEEWTIVRGGDDRMVHGSGRVTKEERPIGNFRRVETLGSEMIRIRVGPRPSLVIVADDNILPLISTEVRGGTLRIRTKGSFRMHRPIKVWVTVPDLQAYRSLGSGSAWIEGINNERLALTLTGSGNVKASGRTRELMLTIDGSGRADLAGLTADSVQVALHGSGDATVRPNRNLSAELFGSGSLRYLGRPASIEKEGFGTGCLIALG